MRWLGWLTRARPPRDGPADEWRRLWREAIEAPEPRPEQARGLRATLQEIAAAGGDGDELEIEHEMLDGFEALVMLAASVAATGPPRVPTGHRAVGAEPCCYSAPASLPDDPGQPTGTLLITPTKLIFVGGSRRLMVPWHGVARCLNGDRDVVLVRRDTQDVHRLRCNTFGDALCAGFLARHLAGRHV